MNLSQEQKFKFRLRLEKEQAAKAASSQNQTKPDIPFGTVFDVAQSMAPWNMLRERTTEALGEKVAEVGGEMGYPTAGAAVGTAIQTAPDVLGAMTPKGTQLGRILKPVAPAARQAAVQAAEEIGMPLRPGEVTGSKFLTGISNFMEKTALGAAPENAFTAKQFNALNTEKQKLLTKFGNPGDTYSAGSKFQKNIGLRGSKMKAAKDVMFENVSDDVRVPLRNVKETADTLIDEQSRLYGGTQSPEVTRWAKIVQDAETSSGKGVTGGPEYFGYTRHTPDEIIPGKVTIGQREPAAGQAFQRTDSGQIIPEGEPASPFYVNRDPDQVIPGGPVYEVGARVYPEEQFASKPNYFALKRLRENLNGAIEQAKQAKNQSDYRDLSRLKASLDKDINEFAVGGVSPLDDLKSAQFKENYRKANAFSGAYKNLFKSDEARTITEAPPEKVVDMVFKKNNETAIKKFRAMAGEDGFLPVKQKFTQELLESNNLLSEINKYEEGTLRAIYSADELAGLKRYANAQTLPKTTANLQGTQGSARSNIAASQWGGLYGGILALLSGNLPVAAAGIGQFVAPAALSRMTLAAGKGFANPAGNPLVQKAILAEYLRRQNNKENSR